MADTTLLIAFLAGIVSFLSPCVLPLIPAFLGYLAGTSAKEASRWLLFLHALLFVLGFSAVFSLLGVLLNTALKDVAGSVQLWLSRMAGVIIIAFGLYLTGLLKLRFLEEEHKLRVRRLSNRYATSFLFGAAFAVGWTPCVGAVLGTILALATSQPGQAFTLLLAYSLGLGLPFLAAGLFAERFLRFVQKSRGFFRYFSVIIGILVIALGILVFTMKLTYVSNIGFFLEMFFS
jgi:cytochrome c-type biogenesis protein